MSDLQRLETVLDQITNSIIYAVRQDTHEILYFNAQAKKMAPQIERGRICQELWAETCKDCPLEKIPTPITSTAPSAKRTDMLSRATTARLAARSIFRPPVSPGAKIFRLLWLSLTRVG